MNVGRPTNRRIVAASTMLLVTSIVGIIAASVIGVFVLDKYNAYGEVPIPGSATVHLPAGETTVSFHTRIVGSTNGRGLPIPALQFRIAPPPDVAAPEVTEDIGSTITVNSDAHVRLWVVQIPVEGDYDISTDGEIGGFISPRLAFGYSGSRSHWIWAFVAVFVVGVLGIVVAWVRGSRTQRAGWAELATQWTADDDEEPLPKTPQDYTPSDEGIRLEQLKTIAALLDSGALTKAEFEAEKRRILGGH